LHLILLLSSFVFLSSFRWILTKLTDLHEMTVLDADGNSVEFKHPMFQTELTFLFEFLLFALYAVPTIVMMRDRTRIVTKHYYLTFLWPALCDFVDCATLNMGMITTSPSLSTMIRTLMCPASALLAYFLLNAKFTWA